VAAVVAATPKVTLTPAQSKALLTKAGLVGTNPPSYALVSVSAFNAWAAKVKANRALLNQVPSGRYAGKALPGG
jgi:hypothetical protein